MNIYISRTLKSIPCIVITIMLLPVFIIMGMGPVSGEKGGESNRKAETDLFNWLIKLWTRALQVG